METQHVKWAHQASSTSTSIMTAMATRHFPHQKWRQEEITGSALELLASLKRQPSILKGSGQ